MEKDLENLGIYDLRNYARAMGVKSPTTLKRNELIEKINQIVEGETPAQKSNKKGRPPKHSATDNYVLDMILPDNIFKKVNSENLNLLQNKYDEKLNQNVFSESKHNISSNNVVFKGFYEEFNEDYGIAYFKGYMTDYSKENTMILRPLVEKYGLKTGDYVVGNARYVAQKNIMLATEINFVNDISVDKLKRTVFDKIKPYYPTEKITFADGSKLFEDIDNISPLAKGSRVVINITNEKVDLIKKMLNVLTQKNNIRTLLISIDDSPEDIASIMVDCPDVEVCQLSNYQTRPEFFKEVEIYIRNCVNRLECGENVAIVFYNEKVFQNSLMQNFIISKNIPENTANILAFDKMKDILYFARNFNDSSLTILTFDANEMIRDFSNCYIEINFDESNKNLYLNKQNSFTKNIDKIN